jgi:hypothetical protein
MIREKQYNNQKPIIDLTGPQGNAFCLMGYAKSYARQLQKDGDAIVKEMMQGDYEHLLEVFDKEFGDYVILER